MLRKLLGIGKVGRTDAPQVLLAKLPLHRPAELHAQLGIVAQRGVGIQRQVVGKQVDVVGQQHLQALLHPARHPSVLAAPEQAVVHEDSVGFGVDGGLDQRAAGRHARDDGADLFTPLDLQAIGAVVLEAGGLQQVVEGLQHGVAVDGHGLDCLSPGHPSPQDGNRWTTAAPRPA